MRTQKPLEQLIPDINKVYRRYEEQLEFDLKLYEMYEGQIRKYVEGSLRYEIKSPEAYKRAIQRIPTINLTQKVTNKISKVYHMSPERDAQNAGDRQLIRELSRISDINHKMDVANNMLNLHKRSAVEFYVQDGVQRLRVLGGHQFFVYSDSPSSPDEMTVFIKLMGRDIKDEFQTETDQIGRVITDRRDPREVQIMVLSSETENLVIDSSGRIRQDLQIEMGIPRFNRTGVIPYVYLKKSPLELMPLPNQTLFDMSILVPKLLADLNYAAQFNTHSIVWVRNTDIEATELNPDNVVNLGDATEIGRDPDMGVIEPKVDIEGILSQIEFQFAAWLSTEGARAGASGQLQGNSDMASGISKIVDQADATEMIKSQMTQFKNIEKQVWKKFSILQSEWSRTGVVQNKQTFTANFPEEFSVRFGDIRPLESDKSKLDRIKNQRDIKLITKKQALREIYPEENEAQIERRLKEIEEEMMREKEQMLTMGLTPSFMQLASQQTGGSSDVQATSGQDSNTSPQPGGSQGAGADSEES